MDSYNLKNGYLDKDIEYFSNDLKNSNKDLFNLINYLNRTCYKSIHQVLLKNESGCGAYITALMISIHKSFQSSTILFQKGLEHDALIILRCIYEKLFYMKALINDEKNYNDLIENELNKGNNLRRKINKSSYLDHFKHAAVEVSKTYRNTELYKWADKAGMKKYFDYQYTALSSYVHFGYTAAKELNEKPYNIFTVEVNYIIDLCIIFREALEYYCENKNLKEFLKKLIMAKEIIENKILVKSP